LSLLKNDLKEKLSVVILCAGEGTRLKKITKTTPKPLIKIEKLNNISILHHAINNLIKLKIKKIGITIGYLGNIIHEFISTLKRNNQSLQDKLIIIDTENQYKFGPLYSFLSITKNQDFFTSRNYYLVIPGDTIFDYNILKEVLFILSKNLNLFQEHPFIFYRKIGLKSLEELYSVNRKISNAEITKVGLEIILKKISQLKIKDIAPKIILNQLIPITALNYDSINEILNFNRENLRKTIWETFNYIVFNGKKVLAFEIESKYDFYDIDYADDIKNL
jgi:choline kinase